MLICEGRTDGGLLSGIADRSGGFDADGIAVVHTGGKTQLAISWAILEELGVPTYVVFDGDSGCRARLQAQGKTEAEVVQAEANAQLWNRRLLGFLGTDVEDWPQTSISTRFAVLGDQLETELANWAGWLDECAACQEELGAWRVKSEEVYRLAAGRLATDPPEVFARLIDALRLLG